ncbi:MAG: hypothetical protein PF450_06060, partial [Bacteroidales bacterium]|nr:hypothetical protein [Bacteroidales bacterium]
HPINFEYVIGVAGGGCDDKQRKALIKISQFLHIDLSEEQLERIKAKIYNPKSITFNKGKIGKWRSSFTHEQIESFNIVAGHYLKKYGY